MSGKVDHVQIEEEFGENSSLLNNVRLMGYTQPYLVRNVFYATRENVNFIHEIYRQAFLLNFNTKQQIEAMRIAVSIYKEWISGTPPPFLLETDDMMTESQLKNQRLRTDSYVGAMGKDNIIVRAGLQNILQVFITNAVNVFMIQTAHLNINYLSR